MRTATLRKLVSRAAGDVDALARVNLLSRPDRPLPQPGPQTDFLAAEADVVLYGGAAGGGKSFGLLLDPLKFTDVPGFRAVIFRRTSPQITAGGGLWDTAGQLYRRLGGEANRSGFRVRFPAGAEVAFRHLQHEDTKYNYDGSQYASIGFDELTHFSESQFIYLFSRNRSTCGVKPRVRATCNPDAGSWVKPFIQWWLDPVTGLPITERAGVHRWFYRVDGEVCWYDTQGLAEEAHPDLAVDGPPKSVTFIPARLADNAVLCRQDPGYRANLLALSWVERSRLFDGNWNATAADGLFRADWFPPPVKQEDLRSRWKRKVRAWDLAATEAKDKDDPDWLAGVLLGQDESDRFWVLDVRRVRVSPLKVKRLIREVAEADGREVEVVVEQEPAAAGKIVAAELREYLSASRTEQGEPQEKFNCYIVRPDKTTGDKVTRAYPFSAACEQGKVWLAAGGWLKAFLAELTQFPTKGVHDDQVDSAVAAFRRLSRSGLVWA